MGVHLNPYLNFLDGRAREAMEFYRSVLGGDLDLMTFGQMGTQGPLAEQVMHGQLQTPDGFLLMGADAPAEMVQVTVGNNMSVSLSGDDTDKLTDWFERLSAGGQVQTALEKQVWGDYFGAFTDRFGINWLVNIAGEENRG